MNCHSGCSAREIALIVEELVQTEQTPEAFCEIFPGLFAKHYGRAFSFTDPHDLMLCEMAFTTAFGWLGDDGVVYR